MAHGLMIGMKLKVQSFKILLTLLLFLGFQSNAFCFFDFLSCSTKKIQDYQKKCQSNVLCGLKNRSSKCIQDKANACFCLTYIGGKNYRTDKFDFKPFQIYGNWCGWRSGILRSDGIVLDWGDKEEVLEVSKKYPAIDELDEACKQHDLEYGKKGIDICESDSSAIKKMIKFSNDPKNSVDSREIAFVMAESLKKNNLTCHVLNLVY